LRCDYHGRLDLLVNNAGYGLFGALEDLDEEQLRHQMEVNFFGAAMVTRGVLPFIRSAVGRIINVSSICGRIAMPLSSAYCASKFALEGLTESLYFELRPQGIQVALVEPGGFRTRFGDAIHWGAHSFSESVYREETDGFLSLRNRLASRVNPPDPATVSERIFRLAEARQMPLRTVIGTDAGQLSWVRRLLPESLYLPLMRALFRKSFKGSRDIPRRELAHEPTPYTLSD
jgi:NAD(P)-dependent dehydrogenase (short-subunit alcohol dehydrogenase family)